MTELTLTQPGTPVWMDNKPAWTIMQNKKLHLMTHNDAKHYPLTDATRIDDLGEQIRNELCDLGLNVLRIEPAEDHVIAQIITDSKTVQLEATLIKHHIVFVTVMTTDCEGVQTKSIKINRPAYKSRKSLISQAITTTPTDDEHTNLLKEVATLKAQLITLQQEKDTRIEELIAANNALITERNTNRRKISTLEHRVLQNGTSSKPPVPSIPAREMITKFHFNITEEALNEAYTRGHEVKHIEMKNGQVNAIIRQPREAKTLTPIEASNLIYGEPGKKRDLSHIGALTSPHTEPYPHTIIEPDKPFGDLVKDPTATSDQLKQAGDRALMNALTGTRPAHRHDWGTIHDAVINGQITIDDYEIIRAEKIMEGIKS